MEARSHPDIYRSLKWNPPNDMNMPGSDTFLNKKSPVPRIGLMIIPSDPFWIQIYQAIVKTNQRLCNELITLHPATMMDQLDTLKPEVIIDQVLAQGLDVLITTEVPSLILSGILERGLRVICLAEVVHVDHPMLTILADMHKGGYMAGEMIGQHLGGSGHAVIVTAAKMKIQSIGQSRLAGFMDAMKQYPGIQVDHIPCFWTYQDTYKELLTVFQDYPSPIDAVFGISDSILFAVRDAAQEKGRIDKHTILVGLNGDPQMLVEVAEGTVLATIDVDAEGVGIQSMEYAHQAAYGNPIPKTIPWVYQMVTRENVAAVAAHKLTVLADLPNHLVGYDRQKEHDRLLQFEAMAEVSHQIGAMLSRAELSEGISLAVQKAFGYEWTRILHTCESGDRLVYYGGVLSPDSTQIPIEQDELLQMVLANSEPIIIPDTDTAYRWHVGQEWKTLRARAILPIPFGEKIIGVLDLQSSSPILQPSFETTGLRMLAEQVGIAIQNATLYNDALEARQKAESYAAENSRLYAVLMKSSLLDELTGAFNRRGLMEQGRTEMSHALRLKYEVGLMMFDLDNFKVINDRHGHGVGDRVLRAVVEEGQANIREIDTLARYGGDEFVIIMPGCNLETVKIVAERLRAGVERLTIHQEEAILRITVSVGVAVYTNQEITLEELLRKADLALYAAKQAGKNNVQG